MKSSRPSALRAFSFFFSSFANSLSAPSFERTTEIRSLNWSTKALVVESMLLSVSAPAIKSSIPAFSMYLNLMSCCFFSFASLRKNAY